VDGHRTAERRSLAYHAAIAERFLEDPSILEAARGRVDDWQRTGAVAERWTFGWAEILSRSPAEIAAMLVDPGEQMTALRQSSPFVGVLDPRTRWRLWRSVPH